MRLSLACKEGRRACAVPGDLAVRFGFPGETIPRKRFLRKNTGNLWENWTYCWWFRNPKANPLFLGWTSRCHRLFWPFHQILPKREGTNTDEPGLPHGLFRLQLSKEFLVVMCGNRKLWLPLAGCYTLEYVEVMVQTCSTNKKDQCYMNLFDQNESTWEKKGTWRWVWLPYSGRLFPNWNLHVMV